MTTRQLRIAELKQLIEDSLNSPFDDFASRISYRTELETLQKEEANS